MTTATSCAGRCCISCGDTINNSDQELQDTIKIVENFRCSKCRHFHGPSEEDKVIVSTPVSITATCLLSASVNAVTRTTSHAAPTSIVGVGVEQSIPSTSKTAITNIASDTDTEPRASVKLLCTESDSVAEKSESVVFHVESSNLSEKSVNMTGHKKMYDFKKPNEVLEANDSDSLLITKMENDEITENIDTNFQLVEDNAELPDIDKNFMISDTTSDDDDAAELEPLITFNDKCNASVPEDVLPTVEVIQPMVRDISLLDLSDTDVDKGTLKEMMHRRPQSLNQCDDSLVSEYVEILSNTLPRAKVPTSIKKPGAAVRISSKDDLFCSNTNGSLDHQRDLTCLPKKKQHRKKFVRGTTVLHKNLPLDGELATEVLADDDSREEDESQVTLRPLLPKVATQKRKISIPYKITQDGTKVNYFSDISKL